MKKDLVERINDLIYHDEEKKKLKKKKAKKRILQGPSDAKAGNETAITPDAQV